RSAAPRRGRRTAARVAVVLALAAGLVLGGYGLIDGPDEGNDAASTGTDRPAPAKSSASRPATTAPGPTRVTQLTPWDEIGAKPAAGIEITGRAYGSCGGGSLTLSGRPDAWRCNADDGQILDPCFTGGPMDAQHHDVLCMADSPKKMLRFELAQQLPDPDEYGNSPAPGEYTGAYRIKLANGQTCGYMGGATTTVGGKRLNFGCPQGYAYGDPDTGGPVWTIAYKAKGAASLKQVGIAAVYQ
ncbi:hypothetical protein G5C51_22815, partial [Streptomyces sp. A7024]|nr:hypothetical protein [Streptomyces coryli]